MGNPYCPGCGRSVNNGDRRAQYGGLIWHSMCAVTDLDSVRPKPERDDANR